MNSSLRDWATHTCKFSMFSATHICALIYRMVNSHQAQKHSKRIVSFKELREFVLYRSKSLITITNHLAFLNKYRMPNSNFCENYGLRVYTASQSTNIEILYYAQARKIT